jgi:hypothetical protein
LLEFNSQFNVPFYRVDSLRFAVVALSVYEICRFGVTIWMFYNMDVVAMADGQLNEDRPFELQRILTCFMRITDRVPCYSVYCYDAIQIISHDISDII